MSTNTVEVVFLLLLPKQLAHAGKIAQPQVPKEAPPFFYHDIGFRSLGSEEFAIASQTVTANYQVLDERVWLAECRYQLDDAYATDAVARKEEFENKLRAKFLAEHEPDFSLYEEYSILLISSPGLKPDAFLEKNAGAVARLLRSVEKPLDRQEREAALSQRVRYSAQDVVIVDWGGALAFDPDEDFQSDIDLIKIASFQLLRYRMLDQVLEEDLHELERIIRQPRHFSFVPRRRDQLMYNIVRRRLSLLLDFEKVDQSLLQIGDWYSAQLYRAIAQELNLDQWRTIVSNKLDNLKDIREVVTQELTLTWERLLDIISLVGWTILLVGYFWLFFIDAGVYGG